MENGGVSITRSEPYSTYEDAERLYVTKLKALLQPPREPTANTSGGVVELPAETFLRRAEEVVDVSSGLLRLAKPYLKSADPITREGIRSHFIDQATVELLLGIELFRISEGNGAIPFAAAIRATHSAALREAISAVESFSSTPVLQGIPGAVSFRDSESATIDEAVSELKLAVESTARSISRRVQELGADIAGDLATGMRWAEVAHGASLSGEEIGAVIESIQGGAAGELLLHAYKKILALPDTDAAGEFRIKIKEWLVRIEQENRVDLFNTLVDKLYRVEARISAVSGMEGSTPPTDSLNRSADLMKVLSDKFIVLIGRMRKLEDAIRLVRMTEVPQFRIVTIALHVALLSALMHAGQDYIDNRLMGILRETGFCIGPTDRLNPMSTGGCADATNH